MKIQDVSVAILGGQRMVNYDDALAAIEQARREAFEECESVARNMFNRAATGDEIADAIRARGEAK